MNTIQGFGTGVYYFPESDRLCIITFAHFEFLITFKHVDGSIWSKHIPISQDPYMPLIETQEAFLYLGEL